MRKEVLRLNNIYLTSNTYGSLRNISFHLLQGEFLGLFGILNSGVKLLVRILREQAGITSGSIYRSETRVTQLLPPLQPCLDIGYVGQTGTLMPGFSIKENLMISRRTGRKKSLLIDDNSLNAEIAVLLEDLGIDDLITPAAKLNELSPFERHLIEIAKLVYAGKDIIMLDEIGYSYMETDFRRLSVLINKLKEKNISVIYVCNSIDHMAEYLDRIIILRDGRNAGTMYSDSFDRKNLMRMLLGPRHTSASSTPLIKAGKPVIRFSYYGSSCLQPVRLSVSESETVGIFSLENSIPEELAELIVSVNLRRKRLKHKYYKTDSGWEAELYDPGKELVVIPQNAAAEATYPEKSILENYLLLIYRPTSKMGCINADFSRYMEHILDKWYGKETGWSRRTKLKDTDEATQKKSAFHKWLFHRANFSYIEFPGIYADPLLQQSIFALIHEMAEHKMGILIRSNNIYELLTLCSKLVIISKQGRSVVLSREEALSIDLFELLIDMK